MSAFFKGKGREDVKPTSRNQDLKDTIFSATKKESLLHKLAVHENEQNTSYYEDDKENVRDNSNLFVDSASGNIKYRPSLVHSKAIQNSSQNKSLTKRNSNQYAAQGKTANIECQNIASNSNLEVKKEGKPLTSESHYDHKGRSVIGSTKNQLINMMNSRSKINSNPKTQQEGTPKPKSRENLHNLSKPKRSVIDAETQERIKGSLLQPYYLKSIKQKYSPANKDLNTSSKSNSLNNTGKIVRPASKSPANLEFQSHLSPTLTNLHILKSPLPSIIIEQESKKESSNKKASSSHSASKTMKTTNQCTNSNNSASKRQSSQNNISSSTRILKKESGIHTNPSGINLYDEKDGNIGKKTHDELSNNKKSANKSSYSNSKKHSHNHYSNHMLVDINKFQIDHVADEDYSSKYNDSNAKNSNSLKKQSQNHFIMDSLKKVVITDSGIKRNKSQLKMDDLQGIFEDDKKFIESTKKQNKTDFSFSDEKKKQIRGLLNAGEVETDGLENVRKLDFNCTSPSQINSNQEHQYYLGNLKQKQYEAFGNLLSSKNNDLFGNQIDNNQESLGRRHVPGCEEQNKILNNQNSNLSFEKLKNQKRAQNAVDFLSIKNNLKIKRLRKNDTSSSEIPLEDQQEAEKSYNHKGGFKENLSATQSVKKLKAYSGKLLVKSGIQKKNFGVNEDEERDKVFNKTMDGRLCEDVRNIGKADRKPQLSVRQKETTSVRERLRMKTQQLGSAGSQPNSVKSEEESLQSQKNISRILEDMLRDIRLSQKTTHNIEKYIKEIDSDMNYHSKVI